jgi:hypothetical protein
VIHQHPGDQVRRFITQQADLSLRTNCRRPPIRAYNEPARKKALDCLTEACANPKSFGHAHHSYYQIACILALLGRRETAFDWLERSVSSGFACWPFFLKDTCLKNLHELPEFEVLVSALQAKYPDHLGLL